MKNKSSLELFTNNYITILLADENEVICDKIDDDIQLEVDENTVFMRKLSGTIKVILKLKDNCQVNQKTFENWRDFLQRNCVSNQDRCVYGYYITDDNKSYFLSGVNFSDINIVSSYGVNNIKVNNNIEITFSYGNIQEIWNMEHNEFYAIDNKGNIIK